MNKKPTICLVVMFVCIGVAEGTSLDDGRIHDISETINQRVEIYNGPSGNPTTLNLHGELAGGVMAYDDSRLNILSGLVKERFWAYDNSHVQIAGGVIQADPGPYGASQWTISGGLITGNLHPHWNSQVTISGGNIDTMNIWRDSRVFFSGGSIQNMTTVHGGSHLQMSGGLMEGNLSTWDNSVVSISAGSINANVTAAKSSELTISGGSIAGVIEAGHSGTFVYDASLVYIVGSDFEINGLPVSYGAYAQADYPSGHLTGILSNGDSISNDFYIYEGSKIVLVPEPATLSLLALGGMAMLRRATIDKLNVRHPPRPPDTTRQVRPPLPCRSGTVVFSD